MTIFVQVQNKSITKITLTMLLPKDLTRRYRKIKDRGDGKTLTKLLRFKDQSNISAILSGDRGTTLAKIEKIKQFIEDREKLVAALSDSAA